jgi:hypothetical protein
MDARIGKLTREGKEIFYITEGGYTEGTVQQLEEKLSGTVAVAKPKKSFKTFSVTITPNYQSYGSGWSSEEYKTEVVAYDRNDALKQARKQYNENSGFKGDTATYSVKVVK